MVVEGTGIGVQREQVRVVRRQTARMLGIVMAYLILPQWQPPS